jgi:putative aminopeptidase FrvX
MRKESFEFLERYLDNASPVGFEISGQKIWLDYIAPYVDTYFSDTYGTVVGVINPEAEYKVAIEAHADEISWFVSYITSDGQLNVVRNGFTDHQIAPAKRVNIHTPKGIVKGVFAWPSIQIRNKKSDQAPQLSDLSVDCGCDSAKEVEKLDIHVGSVITYEDTFMVMNGKYFTGRGMDNRAGGFIIAEVARMLHEKKKKLKFGVYLVNSVQEETGLNGAKMIAENIRPNVAIITDVIHDTQHPNYTKALTGDIKCGKGPVLSYAPAVHRTLLQMLIDTAKKNKIPYQLKASSEETYTDTEAFAFSHRGVASALISLPLKYMHTTVETAHRNDIENATKLFYEFLVQLKAGTDFKYLK